MFLNKLPANIDDQLEELTEDAVDSARETGMIGKFHGLEGKNKRIEHVSFSLLPISINKEMLNSLIALQPYVTKLIHKASIDREFVVNSLQSLADVDDYVRTLLDIYKELKPEETCKTPVFLFMRVDYMLAYDELTQTESPKHIENSSGAPAFAGIAGRKIHNIHARVLRGLGMQELIPQLPDNKCTQVFAQAFVKAWECYGNPKAVITFLLLEDTKQIFDRRPVIHAIHAQNPEIKVRMKYFSKLQGRLEKRNSKLYIDNEETAIVFFAAGRSAKHYTKELWKIRREIEMSCAIKCPTVGQSLVSLKAMQEVFARPQVLERFLEKSVAEKLRQTYVGFHKLDMTEAGDQSVEMAIRNPERFVMKPQRDGEGCNVFGEEIADLLKKIGGDQRRSAYTLMNRIIPKPRANYFVESGSVRKVELIPEIGIFGALIASGNTIVLNECGDYFLRAKLKESNEACVFDSQACISSPIFM